ncbi:MAG TPA: hypothetical protein VIO38_07805 [Rariglobus sp.]
MDRHFFNFTGIDPDALLAELATGKGDGEILDLDDHCTFGGKA